MQTELESIPSHREVIQDVAPARRFYVTKPFYRIVTACTETLPSIPSRGYSGQNSELRPDQTVATVKPTSPSSNDAGGERTVPPPPPHTPSTPPFHWSFWPAVQSDSSHTHLFERKHDEAAAAAALDDNGQELRVDGTEGGIPRGL